MPAATSIFKYRSFNKTSLELFINKELWFAKPDSLNDPFECQMLLPEVFESIWRHYDTPKNLQNEIETALSTWVEEMGICSFSRTRQNQLMWAHYADEHKGFCIGFSERKLKHTSSVFYSHAVKYQKELPYKNIIDKIKTYKNKPNTFKDFQNSEYGVATDILNSVIGTKYTNWKYEKEIRLIMKKSGAVKFCPSTVVSIAFGLRMSDQEKTTLRELLSGCEWDHLKWYQAKKQPDKFGLLFERV